MTDGTPLQDPPKAIERDAVIFLSGLGHDWSDQSIDGMAKRIINAFDVNAATPGAQFKLQSGKEEDYSEGCKTNLRTISRKDGDTEVPILDLYDMDYMPTLTKRYESRNLLIKSVLLAAALLSALLRFLPAFSTKRGGKTFKEKLQILYAMMVLGLLSAYMVILITAVFATVQGNTGLSQGRESPVQQILLGEGTGGGSKARETAGLESRKQGASTPAVVGQEGPAQEGVPANLKRGETKPADAPSSQSQGWLLNFIEWLKRHAVTAIVLLAALGAFTPEVKGKLVKAAVEYLCTIYYLNLGERRNVILGQLTALLEHIGEKSDTPYRNIHIFSFSFGTIVALDALFPPGRESERRFSSIETLVTIGCPFDMVRTFWPAYFEERYALSGTPRTWINVFSPVDVLSSNFRDDDAIADAMRTIEAKSSAQPPLPVNIAYTEAANPKNLSFFDWITLIGLRAHAMYWGREYEAESNCFNQVIAKLYDGDPALD